MQKSEVLERTSANAPQPEKAVKWRNLYYNKDGSNGCGHKLHDSQEKAEAGALEDMHKMREGWTLVHTNGVEMTKETFAWHLQLPVLV